MVVPVQVVVTVADALYFMLLGSTAPAELTSACGLVALVGCLAVVLRCCGWRLPAALAACACIAMLCQVWAIGALLWAGAACAAFLARGQSRWLSW